MDKINNTVCKGFFIFFLGISIVAIIISAFFLFRAYYGYKYKYVPLLKDIKIYYDGLYTYYINEGKNTEDAKVEAENEVDLYLSNVYVEATTNNMEQNEKKLKFLRLTGWSLSIVLLTSIFAFIPYFMGANNDNIQKIKIVNTDTKGAEQFNKPQEKTSKQQKN